MLLLVNSVGDGFNGCEFYCLQHVAQGVGIPHARLVPKVDYLVAVLVLLRMIGDVAYGRVGERIDHVYQVLALAGDHTGFTDNDVINGKSHVQLQSLVGDT